MIRFYGTIHLEDEDIAVESLKFLGYTIPTGGKDLVINTQMNLTLENDDDYVKLLELGEFTVDFGDVIINNCVLNSKDQSESIKILGFLEGNIESEKDCLKMIK